MTKIEAAFQSIDRGLALARQKRFAEARQEFVSAAKSDPENSAAWADLGAADMETGRAEEGRAAYDKALLLAPDDWRTRFNFGLFFARMKNPDAALAQLQQVFHPARSGAGPAGQQLQQVLRAAETDPVLAGLRKGSAVSGSAAGGEKWHLKFWLWLAAWALLPTAALAAESSACNQARSMVEEVKAMYLAGNPDHHAVLEKMGAAHDLCPSLGEAWKYAYCSAVALGDKKAALYKGRAAFNGIANLDCGGGGSVAAAPKRPPGFVRNKYALLVGVSKFKDPQIPALQFAAKDAEDLAAFLRTRANFPAENVYVLTNAEATRANILIKLNTILLQAREDDLVLIFISSHGSPNQQDKGFGGIGYIVTYDTSLQSIFVEAMEYQDFAAKASLIKARRKVVFLDTCYSGQMKPGGKGLDLDEGVGTQTANLFLSGEGTYVVTSSKDNERSWESDRLKNGFFTYYLINALKQGSEPPTIRQVFDSLSKEVTAAVAREKNAPQNPQLLPRDAAEDLRIGVIPKADGVHQ